MRKSTVIASCLVNSSMMKDLSDAEVAVESVFRKEFPHKRFLVWNDEVADSTSKHIISSVGRASRINVRKFIEDLL